jgi:hypothetical protein
VRKFFTIVWIAILITLIVAIFTKPSYDETFFKVSNVLNARGYRAGLFFNYDKYGHRSSPDLKSTVVIKDRLFYRDVYFPVNGETKKVAVAAFTKLFLVNY